MDWPIAFSAAAFGVMLTGTIGGFVWLILRLALEPLKSDIDELKSALRPMELKLKSEAEIQRMTDLAIARHVEDCRQRSPSFRPSQTDSQRISASCVIAGVVALLLACGCQTNPMTAPARAFLDSVGPEYLAYVEADPTLDEAARRARRANCAAFRLLVEEAERGQ